MSNYGLPYYKVDTDRYDDIRIKKLKKDCGASGMAIYDYILCQIYGGKGYYIVEDEEFLFNVADYLNVKRQNVSEVIGYACAVGLFNKELRTCESILTSAAIQNRWYNLAKRVKRTLPQVDSRYWLCPELDVVQQSANVVQQMPNVVQQIENVGQQIGNVEQPLYNKSEMLYNNPQMSYNIETEKETEKENSPHTPYKEKDKEKELSLIGAEPQIFAEGEVEQVETPTTEPEEPTLTPAEKRERAIAARKQREEVFYNSLIPYVEQYGKEMIREFYDYWSEPTRSGDKMRCEKQETWELTRRLATWAKRTNSYENGRISSTRSGGGTATTPTNGDPHDRYAEITDFIGQRIV